MAKTPDELGPRKCHCTLNILFVNGKIVHIPRKLANPHYFYNLIVRSVLSGSRDQRRQ
jgi:hypothetical protein